MIVQQYIIILGLCYYCNNNQKHFVSLPWFQDLTCMQAVKVNKTPSQLKGERYLRSKNLLVPPSAQRNIERVKLKARALRLKEEYRYKYITRRNSSVARRDTPAAPAPAVPELPEN